MTCPACGTANEPGARFCAGCGEYLDWETGGKTAAAAVAPPATPTVEDHPAAPLAAAGPPAPPSPVEASPSPAPDEASAPAAPVGEPLPAPSLEPPPPAGPAAVKPGEPVRRQPPPPPRPADEEPPAPGDKICGRCGAGNLPARNYCRRCGASLADARVQPQRSWWRRLVSPDPRPAPVAGARPRRRRRAFPVRTVVVLAILGLAAWGVVQYQDQLKGLVTTVQDRIAGDDPYIPSAVTASSESPDGPVANATDGVNDDYWSPAGTEQGPWLDATFTAPYRLVAIGLTGGASTVEEVRLTRSRPHVVKVETRDAAGTTTVAQVTLEDSAGVQRVPVGVDDVVGVRLTVVSTYDSDPPTPVSVAEVEFFGRQ